MTTESGAGRQPFIWDDSYLSPQAALPAVL